MEKKSISKVSIIIFAVLIAAIVIGCVSVGKKASKDKQKDAEKTVSVSETTEPPTKENTTEENPHTVTVVDGITYVDGIMVVNKTYSLPEDYEPGTDSEARKAFNEMREDAEEEDISLWIRSSFRSYETQEELYDRYAERDGKDEADRYSARPGYSEHQSGLAFDVNSIDDEFENTPEGKWLAENCWKYGFIIRYPKDKEEVTGYMYEPWHIRYLGKDVAEKVYESGLTLEEYLGITSEYDY